MSNPSRTYTDIACDACGHRTYEDRVNMTIWSGRGLVVIENVPARVCEECLEQYYDDRVGSEIRQLMASGFPKSRAVREITVPVFALDLSDKQETDNSGASNEALEYDIY